MTGSAAARRYARAMFGIAQEETRVTEVLAELNNFQAVLTSTAEFKEVMFQPIHPLDQRLAAFNGVAELLGMGVSTRNFLNLLIERGRIIEFSAIHEEFGRLVDEEKGCVCGEVVSSIPLNDEQQNRLRQALSAHTVYDVQLEVTVDSTLIGGLTARVGDLFFDGTLRMQLSQLLTNLTKG